MPLLIDGVELLERIDLVLEGWQVWSDRRKPRRRVA